eukprot:2413701-Prymnesium_polylepis.1
MAVSGCQSGLSAAAIREAICQLAILELSGDVSASNPPGYPHWDVSTAIRLDIRYYLPHHMTGYCAHRATRALCFDAAAEP